MRSRAGLAGLLHECTSGDLQALAGEYPGCRDHNEPRGHGDTGLGERVAGGLLSVITLWQQVGGTWMDGGAGANLAAPAHPVSV